MKLFKKILLVIAVIITIPFIIALFVGKDYAVEREIVINEPREKVFAFIKYQKNQDYYNKWIMMDPGLNKHYEGNDGAIGFTYYWEGEVAGKGEQEIKKIVEGERVETELHFIEPMEGWGYSHITTESVGDGMQTLVRWGMKGESNYPMNVVNLFIDGILGADLQTSLETLKTKLESE